MESRIVFLKKEIVVAIMLLIPLFFKADTLKCDKMKILNFYQKSSKIKNDKSDLECLLKTIHYCFKRSEVSKGFELLVKLYNSDPDFVREHKIYQIIKTAQYITNLKNEAKSKQDPKIWNKLALSYYKMGVFNEAINAYKKSLQIDPKQIEPRVTLALILSRVGQKYSAIEELMDVISMDKDNFFAYYYVGKILKYQIKDDKKAQIYLTKAKLLCEKDRNILGKKMYKLYKKDLDNELKK